MGVTELNTTLLNSITNIWYIQAYVHGFDCKTISFKNSVNMFEHMEIAESIYGGVVTPSYKNTTWQEANRTGLISNKRG